MARTVLELRCISCGVKFERSFEKRRGDPDDSEGEMVRLEGSTCPNKCSGDGLRSKSRILFGNSSEPSRAEQRTGLPSRVVLNSNYGELWFELRGTSSFESKC